MVLEIVTAQIKAGQEAAFEEAFIGASKYIAAAAGYIKHELRRCIEVQGKYLIMIHWNSVEDHMVGFRGSQNFTDFRAIVSPFYDGPSQMNHYDLVMSNPAS
ncbi:MAG: antibiotic biosynthesis monooxygenase [Chloroflexi bacterium]|nr:antibiotic biosynthesis monooxygenase [Chloroflexota bacterium]MCC6893360.1 antibiotic biosynthesis monooxygenase [Anaerolineae bacterium]